MSDDQMVWFGMCICMWLLVSPWEAASSVVALRWAVEFCLAAQCKDTITITSLYPPEFLYKGEV